MELYYNYIKSLHLIFVVTWFSGLFYVPRIFIYQIESFKKNNYETPILIKQYKLMSKRLWYIITIPSSILALIFGLLMFYVYPSLLMQKWMVIKLGSIFLLFLYQFKTHQIFKQLQLDIYKYSSFQMRVWNEITTLFLFSIVFLALLKNQFSWMFGFFGIIFLITFLFIAIKLYNRKRRIKNEN